MAQQMYRATDAQGGYFMNPRLSEKLRFALMPVMRFRQFVDIKEGWGKGVGDTLYYNKISNISTAGGTLVETNAMPSHQYTITRGTIALSEWGNAVPFTGKLEALSEFDLSNPNMRVLRDDAAKVLDKACGLRFKQTQRKYTCLTTSTGTLTSVAAGKTLASASAALAKSNLYSFHVGQLVDELKRRNIPPVDEEGNYVCIGSVNLLRGLKSSTNFINSKLYGDPNSLFTGEIGKYDGVRFIEETNYLVNTFGSSSGTNKLGEGVIFGAESVIEGIAIPEELRQKIPTDYGRSKGLAWYAILGFARMYKATDSGQDEHIIHICSTK